MIPDPTRVAESARSFSPTPFQPVKRAVIEAWGNLWTGLHRGSWSFVSGLAAVPLGLVESIRFVWESLKQDVDGGVYVTEIWRERSYLELVFYFLGQLAFVSLPLFVLLGTGSTAWAWPLWLICSTGFALLTIVTLIFPIGARRRYGRLITRHETGYERLFLGLMQPNLLFSARGDGLRACLLELLFYLLLIVLGAGATQMALYGIHPSEFRVETGSAAPAFDAGLFFSFLYISIGSMLTSEYAGLSPSGLLAQTVAAIEVVLGSIYLIALIPTVVTVMARRRPALLVSNPPVRADAINNSVAGATDWLVRQQRNRSHWQGELPTDLVATRLARSFLKAGGSNPRSVIALSTLDDALAASGNRPRDSLEKIVLMIADEDVPSTKLLTAFARLEASSDREEHQPLLAALYAISLGRLPLENLRRYLPANLASWGKVYGPHWGSYALLGRLLVAQLPDGGLLAPTTLEEEASGYCQELMYLRANNGSWYEDIVLTALIGLTFTRLGLYAVPTDDATIWTAREANRRGSGLPLFAGLPVWDTAWVTRALQDEMENGELVRAALTWLVGRGARHGFEGQWSWSTGLPLTCFDTTSMACEVLCRAQIKDVRLASSLRAALVELQRVRDGHRFPTFAPDGDGIHFCPIISARVIRLLQERDGHARPEAEAILDSVANDGWISDWFVDPAISRGLVLAYLAPFCRPRLRSARILTEGIAAETPGSIEGASAMLLGLAAARRNLHLSQRAQRACERQTRGLVDHLIDRRSDRHWEGDRVGTFGFGRRYANPVFATALALRALAAQQQF